MRLDTINSLITINYNNMYTFTPLIFVLLFFIILIFATLYWNFQNFIICLILTFVIYLLICPTLFVIGAIVNNIVNNIVNKSINK